MDSSQSPLVLVTHSEDQLHEVFLTHASQADTLLGNHLFTEPEFSVFVLQHGKEWVQAFDRDKFLKYSSFIDPESFLEAPIGVNEDIEDYTSEKEEHKGRCRCQLAKKLAELVLLEGEQVAVLGDRHYVLEHLLVREQPYRHYCVQKGCISQGSQGLLAQTTIVRRRLNVGICHSNPFRNVVPHKARRGDRDQDWDSWAEKERDVDYVDDVSQSVVHEEHWARVYRFELLDVLSIALVLVTWTQTLLIDASFQNSDACKHNRFNCGGKNVDEGSFGDKVANIQKPL